MSRLPPPDLWGRVDRLFQQVQDLPPRERAARLAQAGTVDPEAASEVRELLALGGAGRDFLEEPVGDVFDLRPPGRPEEARDSRRPEPTRAGPYRLVRRVGRGGTASVYLAERADGQWTQRVAVKILHRGMDTERVVERFRAERQILSSLDHPNIARFLGGGSMDDGRPYLVMEYVDGTPLVEYCDAHLLGLKERLELFTEVAGALESAHRQLVVHRDVKPSNVLVDGQGRVKLLDFGIAKILEPGWDGATTRIGHQVLTPSYASPEQVRGEAITTASDVYQLGILLCELVSGRRPYEVSALSPAALERAITGAEPVPPSALVSQEAARARGSSAEQLRRRLSGDLDTIVLKALRKEATDRYGSVTAMVDDVERYRGGFPVMAQADTVGYRARKFVRRHRVGVGASAVAVLVLAGASVFFQLQAQRAAEDRDRAQVAQARAERVTSFVTRLLQVADPNLAGPDALTALPVLDAGVDLARAELADDPVALADVLGTIGGLYSTLAFPDRAQTTLAEAVELRRASSDDPEGLAEDLIQLAWVHGWWNKDVAGATSLYREAAELAEDAFGPDSPLLARALAGMADLPLRAADGSVQTERRRELVDRALVILSAYPPEEVSEALADALYVSATLPDAGDRRIPELEDALALRREAFGEVNIGIAIVLNDLALALEASDPSRADTLMAEAAALHTRLLGEENPTTLTILNNRAGLLRDQGRFREAEPLYRQVLQVRRESLPEDAVQIAYSLHGLGWVLAETGRPGEAEPHLREMLRILETEGDDMGSVRYRVGRNTLGRALSLLGRYEEATPLLEESWPWALESAPGSPLTRTFQSRLAEHYASMGRHEEAAVVEAVSGGI